MHPQLRQALAVTEAEILKDDISLSRRPGPGGWRGGLGSEGGKQR